MRWCSVLEGIDKESELCHSSLLSEAEDAEHLLLQLAVMDTQATAAYLDAVANEVVSLCAYLLRMLVKERNVVGIRHCEGMVRSHEALLLVAPLKEREVDNPQTLKLVLVSESETVAHLQTERAKLHASLVGVVTGKDKHEVAVLCAGCLFHLCQNLRCVELVH